MLEYQEILRRVMLDGKVRPDRTGVGTKSIFGERISIDLTKGFPLLTVKKMYFKTVAAELLWFLSGSQNIKILRDLNVKIWDAWANDVGDVGPVYGVQWRKWLGGSNPKALDQLSSVIQSIINDPWSRRHIVTAWNPSELADMALPPCHCFFQLYANTDEHLDCQVYMRSCDLMVGLPYDIAVYALLLSILSEFTGRQVGKLVIAIGDAHIYKNHLTQAAEVIRRTPRHRPTLALKHIDSLNNLTLDNFELSNYCPLPAIKLEVAI